MATTSIYIRVRYYGGAYIARVYDPVMKVQASCTSDALSAVKSCAVKAAKREPISIKPVRGGCYRAEFEIAK